MRLPTLATRACAASLTHPLMARGTRLLAHGVACATIGMPFAARFEAQTSAAAVPLQEEVPCTAMRSALHGVVLLGARLPATGGPSCDLMVEYRDWMERSDDLLGARRTRDARFTGREWDFAAGAMRLGAPDWFVLIRGDSLTFAAPGRPRRLHLTAFAAEPAAAPSRLGSWYVLVDEDSVATRAFRSPVTGRRLHQVLEDRGSLVYAVGGVSVDAPRIRAQFAEMRALRAALGFTDPLPLARYVIAPARDTTLSVLGVLQMDRPLFAMMVFPPLAVFAPLSAQGGLDAHEVVHVATFGRRDVIPGTVGEAFAMHHGGSHGRSFAESFCANRTIRGLGALTTVQLDSALAGQWWDDPRADVAGFALGHAVGWFIAQRGDSAWIFADGEPARSTDAIAFLSARSGIPRDTAMARLAEGLEARRLACPEPTPPGAGAVPRAPANPPSATARAPAPAIP